MSRNTAIGIIVSFLLVSIGFQNCGQVRFASSPVQNNNFATGTPTGGGGSGTTGGTTPTIKQFQPAVAVRDSACLACHANVQANLITDFGYGSPWYMNEFNSPTSFGQYHYTATTWQTIAQINGQVIVPQATVSASYVSAQLQTGATPPTSDVQLSNYLTLPTVQNFAANDGWFSYFKVPNPPASPSFTYFVTGQTPVTTAPEVYIGAPTVSEILALAPNNSATSPWVQVLGASSMGIANLTQETGTNNSPYYMNSGVLTCSGSDVVINGTLLLNNLQIYAENGGCRLYVTGPVFIEGPITYLNSGSIADSTDNLQITSATSIIMGVGLNGKAENGDGTTDGVGLSPLQVRLLSDVRGNMYLREATDTQIYQTLANAIYAEGENIGMTLLQDASVPGAFPTGFSAAGQSRASINFQHVLLNAPLIHSRYLGTVDGVIVAESAEFSLGEFSFQYDPVFEKVPVLPALPYDILCTSTNCTPANP